MFFPEVAAVLLALLQHPAMILAAPQSQTIKPVVPEAAVAAAAAVLPATGAVLEARTLSPHIKCYSGGALLSSLGSSSAVDDLINSACSTFATYSGQKFVPDSTVQWCISVDIGGGLKNNLVLMMKYKGEAESFTPLNENYQGGLQEYCYTAMEWALDDCSHGGYFENHMIGAQGVGDQYWDVKVDPNTGSCEQNHE